MFEVRCKDEKAQAHTGLREACSGCASPGWSRAGQDQGQGGRRRGEGRARLGAEVRGQRTEVWLGQIGQREGNGTWHLVIGGIKEHK